MPKISIRFFNDREVRAVWNDGTNGWFFSVLDVVGALNGQDDYAKNRNYWKWLKAKLKREGNQLVSATTQLKLTAPDGKRRLSDVLAADGIVALVKAFPNNKASGFLDWFLYGDNTIDGKSKQKAYALFESGLLESIETGTVKTLLHPALTDKTGDRETFRKGIDHSCHCEEPESAEEKWTPLHDGV